MYFRREYVRVPLLVLLLTCLGVVSCSRKEATGTPEGQEGSVSISGAFALYPLAVQWTGDFAEKYPGVRIDLSAGGAGKGMTDVINGMVDFAMMSRDLHDEEREKGAVDFPVGRDAVLPVLSAANPLLEKIRAHGITAEDARRIWVTGECKTWGQLLGTADTAPINVYTRSDACGAAQTFAAWFGAVQEDLGGTAVYGDPGISKAVIADPFGIGFNNMAYAYDSQSLNVQEGLAVLPLDIDGDGTVAREEDFYQTRSSIAAAIEAGRFPAPPSRNLYLVSKGAPTDSAAVALLLYILGDGQDLNEPNGFVRISRQSARQSLHLIRSAARQAGRRRDNTGNALMLLVAALSGLAALIGVQFFLPGRNARRIYKQRLSGVLMFVLTVSSLLLLVAMLAGLWFKSAPIFEHNTLRDLLSGTVWKPSQGRFGFQPFISGTLAVTLIAILIALPLSLLTAIYLTEYARPLLRRIINPALDILAALPSVIYGVWGILTLIPRFGYSLLTASLVLSVMVLPILISLFVEIFSTVSQDLRDASTALGATHWQTTRKVVVRKSLPGIFAAVVLALSKCVGETIAVMMVCGCLPYAPGSLRDPFYTLPALIGNNYGEMASIPLYESAITFAALLLLLIVLAFNILSRVILYRIEKNNS